MDNKLIERIENMENIDDVVKSAAISAIQTMLEGNKYYTIKTEDYKEYAKLINDTIVIKMKQYDMSGSVALRKEYSVGLQEFVEYVASKTQVEEKTMRM